jgi:hypothetical protein
MPRDRPTISDKWVRLSSRGRPSPGAWVLVADAVKLSGRPIAAIRQGISTGKFRAESICGKPHVRQ